jgi:hypothetical protein
MLGYDVTVVDKLVARTNAALASTDPQVRASTREHPRSAKLAVVLGGFDRTQVDEYPRQLADRLV